MNYRLLLAAAVCLTLGAVSSSHAASYNATFDGLVDYAESTPGGPASCPVGERTCEVEWYGTLRVVTASDVGVQTGDDLVSVVLTSNLGSFAYPLADTFETGLNPGAFVAISGGEINSVDLTFNFTGGYFKAGPNSLTIFGMGSTGAGSWVGETLLASVPEPISATLLLAGLGLVGLRSPWCRVRRSSAPRNWRMT